MKRADRSARNAEARDRQRKAVLAKPYRPKDRAEIARNMSAIRSSENRTEVRLRKALFGAGLRYRKYARDLPGKPDIVFRRAKVAVFVDGDYWHARAVRENGIEHVSTLIRTPTVPYWSGKFARRIEIDDAVTAALQEKGWHVIRLWESDTKKDVESAAREIAKVVRQRTAKESTHTGP